MTDQPIAGELESPSLTRTLDPTLKGSVGPIQCVPSPSDLSSADIVLRGGWEALPHETAPLRLLFIVSIAGLALFARMPWSRLQFSLATSVPGYGIDGAAASLLPLSNGAQAAAPLTVLIGSLGFFVRTGRGSAASAIAVSVLAGALLSEGAIWLSAQLFGYPARVGPGLWLILAASVTILTTAALFAGQETTAHAQVKSLWIGIALSLLGALAWIATGNCRPIDALIALSIGALWAWCCSNVVSLARECIRLSLASD